jgi:hypothetical protein
MNQVKISLKAKLFQNNPDLLFAKRRKVAIGLLDEIYYRYLVRDYTFKELQEYYEMKTKRKPIDRKNLGVWINRLEVHKRAQMGILAGATECTPEFFGRHAEFVVRELEKQHNQ